MAITVDASHLHQRQNPGFITTLPTLGSGSVIVVTTTVSATRSATQLPPQITTTSNSPTRPSPSSTGLSLPPSPTSEASTAIATTTAIVNAVQGPYFGGVPGHNVDFPVTSVFLIAFLLGAIINAIFYRRNLNRLKRAPKDVVSGLIMIFCLSRVISCILRNVWSAAGTTSVAIFLALVSENIG